MTAGNNQSDWFEAAWAEREEQIYVRDFQSLGRGIYPLDVEVFKGLGHDQVDPRWLTVGVLESPPHEKRPDWAYVTSGLSNAWEADAPDATGWSGLGMEFLVQSSSQAQWALMLARSLAAYQLLLAAGRFGSHAPLDFWDRTAIGTPIDHAASQLKALMFAPSPGFIGPRQLPSGKFEYLQVIGITEEEHAYGHENGFEELHKRLLSAGASPVVDIHRRSVI